MPALRLLINAPQIGMHHQTRNSQLDRHGALRPGPDRTDINRAIAPCRWSNEPICGIMRK